jgi:hypothetical protein
LDDDLNKGSLFHHFVEVLVDDLSGHTWQPRFALLLANAVQLWTKAWLLLHVAL